MKMLRRDDEMPIELLKPHPKNPRKDVGDVTELAESIKANGIFQPLTVLSGDCIDGYTVVIGHRRLAAAKLAGLKKVPCNVAEMTEQEQVSTMLLENMQRNDLTVYEQAQGFQMMLDLGETEQSIAEKTGFSKATVRHRVKLLELDREEFEKSQERQPTMADYIELEKISDPKERNKALKSIGTDNFKWSVQQAKRAIEEREAHKAWDKLFKELGIAKVEPRLADKKEDLFDMRYVSYDTAPKKSDVSAVKKAAKDGKLSGYTVRYGSLHVLGNDKPRGKKSKSPEERAVDAKIRRIKKLEAQAKELREIFVKSFTGGHADFLIQTALDMQLVLYTYSGRDKKLKEYLGIDNDGTFFTETKRYRYLMDRHPEIVLFAYIALDLESDNYTLSVVKFNGEYEPNPKLEKWYNVLEYLGYQISDEERALLDGTHECFKEEEK